MIQNNPSPYIVNVKYDYFFFIGAPLLFLGISALSHFSGFNHWTLFQVDGNSILGSQFLFDFSYVLTMSHLVAVFFRSHLNKKIFQLTPYRFTLIPIAIYIALCLSNTFLIIMAVFIRWFDVYHSSLQTFGLGRIYDMRVKNNAQVGRSLDLGMALLTYAGPILGGAAFYRHIRHFEKFEDIGWNSIASIPGWAMDHKNGFTWGVLAFSLLFTIYYVYKYWQFSKEGYVFPRTKILLYVSLTICSIASWGFNSFGQSFFIMESYHALQYFALVWWSENKNMQSVFNLNSFPFGKEILFLIFLTLCFSFGIFALVVTRSMFWVRPILLMSEFLHYWYDGFVWSVRKKQIV